MITLETRIENAVSNALYQTATTTTADLRGRMGGLEALVEEVTALRPDDELIMRIMQDGSLAEQAELDEYIEELNDMLSVIFAAMDGLEEVLDPLVIDVQYLNAVLNA